MLLAAAIAGAVSVLAASKGNAQYYPWYAALGLLFFVFITIFYGIIVVHDISYEIAVHREMAAWSAGPLGHLILLMIAVVAVLNIAHIVEVAIWGVVYNLLEAVSPNGNSFYFAFVNFTTLGYGDVLPVARWQLLGP
jgi:Ion channel